jgi:uncharacterized protein YndB with AHSA1/START domain
MKKLEFNINIAASRQQVWETMLGPETYKQWVNASWPGATYEGKWGKGENIKFGMDGQGGTLATPVEFRPYEFILAKHIAVILNDGSEDRNSDIAKTWIGTTESYSFTEKNGTTTLTVEMLISPEWEKMAADGWPNALAALKEICENSTVPA